MAWSWQWEFSEIPTRMDFSQAKLFSGRSSLPLPELNDDELTARTLAIFFNHLEVWESLAFEPELVELLKRAQDSRSEPNGGFNLGGLTAREMALRASRALLNLRVLAGIEKISVPDYFEQISVATKFTSSLSDDEIAELVSVAEFAQKHGDDWARKGLEFGVPFHKEILMEANHQRFEIRRIPNRDVSKHISDNE